jgi:hypothetical protein
MQIFFSFSLLVDMGGFIGGGRDCAIMNYEGLLFIHYPFSRAGLTGAHGAQARLDPLSPLPYQEC